MKSKFENPEVGWYTRPKYIQHCKIYFPKKLTKPPKHDDWKMIHFSIKVFHFQEMSKLRTRGLKMPLGSVKPHLRGTISVCAL